MKKKAQLSIEFISMTVMGFFVLFACLAIIMHINDNRLKTMAQDEVFALSASIQQEILLANVMHEGYTRTFFIPDEIQKQEFVIESGVAPVGTSSYIGFIVDPYHSVVEVPLFSGSIEKGYNQITRQNGQLHITQ